MSRLRFIAAILALLLAVACVVGATTERQHPSKPLQFAAPS
jgi:hypothetical protein